MGADSITPCGCCIAIIFTVVVVTAIIAGGTLDIIHMVNYDKSQVVSLYVQDLYVPSLAPSLNLTATTTFDGSVLVELKLERAKALTRIGFTEFQMTLFYGQSDGRNFVVGSSMVEGFSMGRKMKRVRVHGKVEALAMPWQDALQVITAGNVVNMVVELRWPSNYYFRYTADVLVDASGHMKEPIEFHPSPVGTGEGSYAKIIGY